MINGTNLLGKDNPRWLIGNATETTKVLDAVSAAPRGPAVPCGGVRARPDRAIADAARNAGGRTLARLIGLARHAGRRLFALNDAEASWRGWQVTELAGGLARQYRDARFDAVRGPLERREGDV